MRDSLHIPLVACSAASSPSARAGLTGGVRIIVREAREYVADIEVGA